MTGLPPDLAGDRRLAIVGEAWLAGHSAEEIAQATGIPVGLVGPCAVRVLGLPQRPGPDAKRARERLDAWKWLRRWRAQWWRPRPKRRRPRSGRGD